MIFYVLEVSRSRGPLPETDGKSNNNSHVNTWGLNGNGIGAAKTSCVVLSRPTQVAASTFAISAKRVAVNFSLGIGPPWSLGTLRAHREVRTSGIARRRTTRPSACCWPSRRPPRDSAG